MAWLCLAHAKQDDPENACHNPAVVQPFAVSRFLDICPTFHSSGSFAVAFQMLQFLCRTVPDSQIGLLVQTQRLLSVSFTHAGHLQGKAVSERALRGTRRSF